MIKLVVFAAFSLAISVGLWINAATHPASAAVTSASTATRAGVVSREQILADARQVKVVRLDRLEVKLGTMSQFLSMHQTKVVEQNVYAREKLVWFALFVGEINPGRGVGLPVGTLKNSDWMVLVYDANTGLAIADRTGSGPEPSGWASLLDLAK